MPLDGPFDCAGDPDNDARHLRPQGRSPARRPPPFRLSPNQPLDRVWAFDRPRHDGIAQSVGGLGVLTNPGSETIGDAYAYPWLSQYQALEYDAMGNFLATVSKGGWERPRSSNWLTVLSDGNVSALGGEDKIMSELSGDVKAVRFDGGFILLAGQHPELGDAGGEIPQAYRQVAQFIKPIRFEYYRFAFIKLPSHLNAGKETRMAENLKWLPVVWV